MAVSNIIGLVLILMIPGTETYSVCYHYSQVYQSQQYTGYCYQGCCGAQCCELTTTTTEAPGLDDGSLAAIVLGCVLGSALFVAIVIIVAICCYYRERIKNIIQDRQVLTGQQTYPLMFQGTLSHAPPTHLPPLSDNRLPGVPFPSSNLPAEGQRMEMTQVPSGQTNDPPDYESLPSSNNGNPLTSLPDKKY